MNTGSPQDPRTHKRKSRPTSTDEDRKRRKTDEPVWTTVRESWSGSEADEDEDLACRDLFCEEPSPRVKRKLPGTIERETVSLDCSPDCKRLRAAQAADGAGGKGIDTDHLMPLDVGAVEVKSDSEDEDEEDQRGEEDRQGKYPCNASRSSRQKYMNRLLRDFFGRWNSESVDRAQGENVTQLSNMKLSDLPPTSSEERSLDRSTFVPPDSVPRATPSLVPPPYLATPPALPGDHSTFTHTTPPPSHLGATEHEAAEPGCHRTWKSWMNFSASPKWQHEATELAGRMLKEHIDGMESSGSQKDWPDTRINPERWLESTGQTAISLMSSQSQTSEIGPPSVESIKETLHYLCYSSYTTNPASTSTTPSWTDASISPVASLTIAKRRSQNNSPLCLPTAAPRYHTPHCPRTIPEESTRQSVPWATTKAAANNVAQKQSAEHEHEDEYYSDSAPSETESWPRTPTSVNKTSVGVRIWVPHGEDVFLKPQYMRS